MRLPDSVITAGKAAVQAQWSDTATITREVDTGHTSDTQEVYTDIACHLSQKVQPALDTSGPAAVTEPIFTLFVDAAVILHEGDAITAKHKGQTFSGLCGMPFNGAFSNSAKLTGVRVS